MRVFWIVPVIASILILGTLGLIQEAYAATIESNGIGGGQWHIGSTWSGGVAPTLTDNVVIKAGDTVTISISVQFFSGSVNIEPGGKLVLTSPIGSFFTTGPVTNDGEISIEGIGGIDGLWRILDNTFTNNGIVTLQGGPGGFSSQILIGGSGEIVNNGSIIIIGGDGFASGSLSISGPFVNTGTITVNSGAGIIAGNLRVFAPFTNECEGIIILNAGTFFDINVVFNNFGTLNNQATTINPQLIIDRSDECIVEIEIGGTIIPIDTTALLIAGFQINAVWIIPVIGAVAGIAIYKLKRK